MSVGVASAATITWSNAVTISASTDVSTTGTLAYAYSLETTAGDTAVLNGVTFSTVTETSAGVFGNFVSSVNLTQNDAAFITTSNPFNSLSTDYKTLMSGGITNAADDTTITLGGLNAFQQYLVQIWISYPLSTAPQSTRTSRFWETATQGSGASQVLDWNVGNVAGGLGQYIIGTFTADAASQQFFVEGGVGNNFADVNAGIQFNAVQVRAIPEPRSFAALLGGVGMLTMVRRRRA